MTKRNLIAIGSGVLTALPAVAWAGGELWSALKAAERIPVIEQRLLAQEEQARETRAILLEMLMLQYEEAGGARRAQELRKELDRLKKEVAK